MKIKDGIPMLLGTKPDVVTSINEWDSDTLEYAVDSVERRYEEQLSQKMSDYNGLVIFTEIIKLLRESELKTQNIEKTIKLCQQKVLMYHQKQYEIDKKG